MKRTILALIILMSFTSRCPAPDIWMNVDAAVVVPVNIYPLTDVDGVIDTGVLYNDAGISVVWNFCTTAGAVTSVAVTPTTSGLHDWAEGTADKGMYTLEIPATGGTINNATEGTGWFSGDCTATIPWRGPTIGFRDSDKNDLEIDDGVAGTNQDAMFDSTGYVGGTINSQSDLVKIHGSALTETAGQLAAAFVKLFNVGTPLLVASDDIGALSTVNYALNTTVNAVTSTKVFTLTAGVQNDNAFRYNIISVQDATDSHWEVRTITNYTGTSREVILNAPLTFTPANGDTVHIMKGAYLAPSSGGHLIN